MCQKLVDNYVPDTIVIHFFGHVNTNSLNNYRGQNSNVACQQCSLQVTVKLSNNA